MKRIPPSDALLADLALDGDRGAFDALFERYFARVYAFSSLRSSSRAAAEHVTERAMRAGFLRLHRVARGEDLALRLVGAAERALPAALHAPAIGSPR